MYRFQYSWGHRADLEFKKKDILNYVAQVKADFMQIATINLNIILCVSSFLQIMKRPPISFAMQYEQCDSDAEDMELDL